MSHLLLLILAVTYSGFTVPSFESLQEKLITEGKVLVQTMPLGDISELLHHESVHLSEPVINKVLTTLKCASQYNVEHNQILTIIDYSLPSNEKRLWVFDLQARKLLFHTYVSHGIKSGTLETNFFSNKNNSKASSIGVYKTEKAYYGREGLSLRLDGLEASFNDNASNRSVVMHGGWYVEEPFIKRYGRPGRSWGCPALPLSAYQGIINTIKENSLLVAYYPYDAWFLKSKFLNCEKNGVSAAKMNSQVMLAAEEPREDVLFATISPGMKHADDNPIVAMSANDYERIFQTKAPLNRMLRRQINKEEYIALSNAEFHHLTLENNPQLLKTINFVVPVLVMIRGYYETQMKILPLGQIKNVVFNNFNPINSYLVNFDLRPSIGLRSSNKFIRWLGL